jgi:hypothetical protein
MKNKLLTNYEAANDAYLLLSAALLSELLTI